MYLFSLPPHQLIGSQADSISQGKSGVNMGKDSWVGRRVLCMVGAVTLLSVSWDASTLTSTLATPVHIPTNTGWKLSSFGISMIAIPSGVSWNLTIVLKIVIFINVYECLSTCVSMQQVHAKTRNSGNGAGKWAAGWEAGNPASVFCKPSTCSWPLSHLSSSSK